MREGKRGEGGKERDEVGGWGVGVEKEGETVGEIGERADRQENNADRVTAIKRGRKGGVGVGGKVKRKPT